MKPIVMRIACPTALLLLSLALVGGCAKPYSNQVVSTSEHEITIADRQGRTERTHELAADAQVTLDGKPARLADLDRGDAVKVTVVRTADKELATQVDAKSQESAKDESKANEPQHESALPAEPAKDRALPTDFVPLPTTVPTPLPIPDLPGANADRQSAPSSNGGQEPLDEATEETVAGIIAKIHLMENHFVVGDEKGMEYNFMVDSDTKFTLNGDEATFGDLSMGQMVKVTSLKDGNMFIAKTVDATSQ